MLQMVAGGMVPVVKSSVNGKNDIDWVKYHVVFDRGLYREIKRHARHRRMRISEFITFVLEETAFLLEKFDLTEGLPIPDIQEKYLGERKADRWIWIRRDLKYKLFHFQDHFKIRGKAAVMRYILRRYLVSVNRLGEEKVKRVRNRLFRMWTYLKQKKRMWKKPFSQKFVNITHMNNIYKWERIEFVNSYDIATEVWIL